jgi:hypothetical protein
MQYLSDENATKLHTDANGTIWYATGIGPPESSKQPLDTFLLSHHLARLSVCVRILGAPQNAELISSLYKRKVRNELANICLAGPNICETPQELNDPVATIMRMRDVFMSTSCGGWHEMVESEYIIYSLIAKKQSQPAEEWFDKYAASLYAAHPLYKVLNFVGGVSHREAAALLAVIVDPRWYVDRRRPDNPAKLELYLGLTPKTQRAVSLSEKTIGGRYARCAAVLNCWKTVPEIEVNFDDPVNFLWRAWRAAGGGVKGDLRASQLFIRYLRENWIDALTRRQGAYDKFFLADKFFKTTEERTAFVSSIA